MGPERVGSAELRSATVDLAAEHPGAHGMGLILRVPRADVDTFVAQLRARAWPEFRLDALAPHGGERFIIAMVEPHEANARALGLDIASEARRHDAAVQAAESGRATLTAPITLVQADERSSRGFLLLVPLFRRGAPTATPEERAAASIGWTYAALLSDEILAGIERRGARLTVRDTDVAGAPPLFDSDPSAVDPAAARAVGALTVHGRRWEISLEATPALEDNLALPSPWTAAVTAGVGALMLGALALSLHQGVRRARDIQAEQARRSAVVASSHDAVIIAALDGTILDWNEGATATFGHLAVHALGRRALDLIVPPELVDEDARLCAQMRRGHVVRPFESERLTRDGRRLDVSISATPIAGADGHPVAFAEIVRDVSEAHRTRRHLEVLNSTLEAQVRERTEALACALRDIQMVIHAMPSMIGYCDRTLHLRVANRAHAEWFGWDLAELRDTPVRALLGEALFAAVEPRMEAALRGEAQHFECDVPRPGDAGVRHAVVRYLPDLVDGEVRGFYVLAHDVTELTVSRQRLADATHANEQLLSTIMQLAIVSITDSDGHIVEVNDAFCDITGYRRDELLGHTHAIVSSGAHPVELWASVWSHVRGGLAWRGEVCNRAKDGSRHWVDTTIAPLMDAHGAVERILAIRWDITARKEAEMTLAKTSSLLATVLESASELAIIATDPALRITVFNAGARRLLGREPRHMVGRAHLTDVYAPTTDGACAGPTALGTRQERRLVTADGRLLDVSSVLTAMRTEGGELLGYLLVAHDIAPQKAAERSTREAMVRAQQASEAKSLFLANVTHELRTPMNAVIGLSHLLAETPLAPPQADLLAKIGAASRSLLRVINDVLDLSKIEAGELTLEHRPFSLAEVLRDLHEMFSAQATSKGLAFTVTTAAEVPDVLVGDGGRLSQILSNLVANALKFTAAGSVHVRVEARGAQGARCDARFTVTDTGIGIPAETHERLFAPFTQADITTTRRFGGTGLGLSIVKRLAARMSGEVGLNSSPGHGSTFWVDLPLERAPAGVSVMPERPRTKASRPLEGLRVLVADDSDINLEVARRILSSEGAQVRCAMDGRETVEVLTAEPAGFDVVLLDLQMPVMGGIDAARLIRSSGLSVPLIALTAGVLESEASLVREAGMDGFMSKPFEPNALVQLIAAQVAARRERPPAPAGPGGAEPPRADDGDRGLRRRLIHEYADLEPFFATHDAEARAARAHKLAGAAGAVGEHALHRAALDCERALRDHAPDAVARQAAVVAAWSALCASAACDVAGWAIDGRPEPAPRADGPG